MRFGELEIRCGPCGPRRQVTEFADLKMPGAIEAVDGVLAQVDSGTVTAGEAIELVLNAQIALRNNGARSLPGNMPASVDWRRGWWSGGPCLASGDVDTGVFGELGPSSLAALSAAREGAQSARDFSLPGRLVGEGGREGWIDRPPLCRLCTGSPEVAVGAARQPCVWPRLSPHGRSGSYRPGGRSTGIGDGAIRPVASRGAVALLTGRTLTMRIREWRVASWDNDIVGWSRRRAASGC